MQQKLNIVKWHKFQQPITKSLQYVVFINFIIDSIPLEACRPAQMIKQNLKERQSRHTESIKWGKNNFSRHQLEELLCWFGVHHSACDKACDLQNARQDRICHPVGHLCNPPSPENEDKIVRNRKEGHKIDYHINLIAMDSNQLKGRWQ